MRIWKECEQILQDKEVEYRLFLLKGPGDAAAVANQVREYLTPCTVVVVGGDGTINEFLTGLSSFEGITFAYIPTGSANDFARGMHLPYKPKDLMDMILDGSKIRNVNVGVTVSGDMTRSFAVSSGIGFDAAVCYASASGRNRIKTFLNTLRLGKLIYLVNALRMLFSMDFFSMKVITDDCKLRSFDKVCFAVAMNTKYEGGGFMFAPKASPVDDELDLVIAEGLPKWKILAILPTAFSGKHVRFQGIHVISCKHVVIQCEKDQCVHTDGEHFGFCRKISISLRKERLRMIVD